jgi:tetratricopeptide (TPR) repeat protein
MRGVQAGRSDDSTPRRLLSALRTCLPGAWIQPSKTELISVYRTRYRMAIEEQKYDIAMIFLNKIIEVDPLDADAKFELGQICHRQLRDYPRAIDHYTRVIRLTSDDRKSPLHLRARESLSEVMEILS